MSRKNLYNSRYHKHIMQERESHYKQILQNKFGSFEKLRLLEIGAGYGGNLVFFRNIGFSEKNLYANEILEDRIPVIKRKIQEVNVHCGNATQIDKADFPQPDIILQSTVFTSVPDDEIKKEIASKMWNLLKPGGIILWYDFQYNNPRNKAVKGIKKEEIRELFSESSSIGFIPVTLAPPIGRIFPRLYHLLNSLSFLRTHLIAVIEKS